MTTIRSVNGREFAGVRVGGYRNLNARGDDKKQWSFRALEGPDKGLKVAEGLSAVITGATPFVRESTRQRILAGSGREVHAWVTGYLAVDDDDARGEAAARVTYRPFERGEFFYAESGAAFDGAARFVFGTDTNCYAS